MLKPRPWQITPRYFWPPLFIALAFGLSAWSYPLLLPQRFTEHWFRNATMLKCLHTFVLGQLGLIFLAVLFQALPVLFHLPQARSPWDKPAQALWVLGLLLFICYLAGWRSTIVLVPGLLSLALGWGLLYRRALILRASSGSQSFAWGGLGPAFLALGAMIGLGSLMAWGLIDPLLPQDPLVTLRLHLHLGLWGFAALAIFGFLPKLLRLFQGSTGYPGWPLKLSFALIQLGLMLLAVDWLGGTGFQAVRIAALCFAAAASSFVLQIALLLRAAKMRRFDSSLVMQLGGMLFLCGAAALDLRLLWDGDGNWRLQGAAVALAVAGFVNMTLLGTLQRICAVLAWFQRFFIPAQSMAVPTAWQLIHPGLAWVQVPLQFLAASCLAFGIWQGSPEWLRLAAAAGCLAQIAAILQAIRCLKHGSAKPFPDGTNPYADWVKQQQAENPS